MAHPFRRSAALLSALFAAVVPLASAKDNPPPDPSGKPRLLVVLVVDQMRAEYVTQFSNVMGAGGIRRLQREGSEFQGSFYAFAGTSTGAGTATISTGNWPRVHGVLYDQWADRKLHRVVGAADGADGKPSAEWIKSQTLADILVQNGGQAVSISGEKSSAILLAGKKGEAVWLADSGDLEALSPAGIPAWAKDWNESWRRYSRWDGKKWEPLVPTTEAVDLGFTPVSPAGFGTAFPHTLPSYEKTAPKPFIEQFRFTPFADMLTEELAEIAVNEKKLGDDEKVDLLAVSFSSPDFVGRVFGPESPEVKDAIVRVDQQIEKLLAHLDKKVGAGNYTVAFTSDHGVATPPERVRKAGGDSGRVDRSELGARFEKYLGEALGAEGLPAAKLLRDASGKPIGFQAFHVFLDPDSFPADKAAAVRDAAARVLASFPEIRYAYTKEVLSDAKFKAPFSRSMRIAADPERGGDVQYVLRNNWIAAPTGTEAGSPDPNDAIVPLIFSGAGVRHAGFRTTSTPADVAPTLLSAAGIATPPKTFAGRVLPIAEKAATGKPEGGDDDAGGAPAPTP